MTTQCLPWVSEWLYYVRFGITGLHVARCPVIRAVWYRRYSRYLSRLTVFFTATIYRGISWHWRYWHRHVSIDDKYRGITGIAQHFYRAMHFSAKRGIAIACRLSVCLSVTLVNCDHIGWNSSKIISRSVSLGCPLFATQTSRVYSKGNTLKFLPEYGWAAEKVAFGIQKL